MHALLLSVLLRSAQSRIGMKTGFGLNGMTYSAMA